MDELLEQLQGLKHIQADEDYTRKSRHLLMSQIPAGHSRTTVWEILRHTAQIGGTIAFASLLVALILGGLSSSSVSPLHLSSLDPASLRAEAQAIDIQIRLTNLNYTQKLGVPTLRESTPAEAITQEAGATKENDGGIGVEKTLGQGEKGASPTSKEIQPVGIDEMLLKLAE